jgi:two-component system chemotaxis response regulator CheY
MQFLIVDDSKAMRMIVRRTLRQAGFESCEAVEAANGMEALKVLETAAPDLILCDWNMPEMSGLELLKELQNGGNRCKFGFVTSESTPEMLGAAMEAGALFIITKPFTPEKFQETLQGVVGV